MSVVIEPELSFAFETRVDIAWLTHTVFVGIAYDDNQVRQIRIRFYEVL